MNFLGVYVNTVHPIPIMCMTFIIVFLLTCFVLNLISAVLLFGLEILENFLAGLFDPREYKRLFRTVA